MTLVTGRKLPLKARMFFCIVLLREEYFSGRVKHHGISHTVLLIANSSNDCLPLRNVGQKLMVSISSWCSNDRINNEAIALGHCIYSMSIN
jgi:hypothetical protein